MRSNRNHTWIFFSCHTRRGTNNLGESIRQVKIVPAENVRPVQEILAASDWSVVIISTLPFSLTGSRGEYLRVVGIHCDG